MLSKGLKAARLKLGLSQKQVSVSLGLSGAQMWSNIERNKASLPAARLKRVSVLLKTPLKDLVSWKLDWEREKIMKSIKASK